MAAQILIDMKQITITLHVSGVRFACVGKRATAIKQSCRLPAVPGCEFKCRIVVTALLAVAGTCLSLAFSKQCLSQSDAYNAYNVFAAHIMKATRMKVYLTLSISINLLSENT